MSDWQKLLIKLTSRDSQLHRNALKYEERSMWSYILSYKEEHKKPNQVDKMRHKAVRRECYKMAVKKLKEEE